MVTYLRRAYDWLKDLGFAIEDTLSSLDEPSNLLDHWCDLVGDVYRDKKRKRMSECVSDSKSCVYPDLDATRDSLRNLVIKTFNDYMSERSNNREQVEEGELDNLIRVALENLQKNTPKRSLTHSYIADMFAYEQQN